MQKKNKKMLWRIQLICIFRSIFYGYTRVVVMLLTTYIGIVNGRTDGILNRFVNTF